MSNQKSGSRRNGRGYYIALILCAVAIGISGYLYYQNVNEEKTNLEQPDESVAATDPVQEDVAAVATQPAGKTPEDTAAPTQPSVTPERKPMKTAAPVQGQTVAAYAADALSYNPTTRDWRTHDGLDIAAEAGTPVCAAADGTVYTVYQDDTMGTTVVITHADGYATCYSSLAAEVSVEPGDEVLMGQTIGCVGQSALLESAIGEHVHFSVSWNGQSVDPNDFLGLE